MTDSTGHKGPRALRVVVMARPSGMAHNEKDFSGINSESPSICALSSPPTRAAGGPAHPEKDALVKVFPSKNTIYKQYKRKRYIFLLRGQQTYCKFDLLFDIKTASHKNFNSEQVIAL